MKTRKRITILGTLDTKGEEIRFVQQLLEARQLCTCVVDTGVHEGGRFQPDISHERVAAAAGADVRALAAAHDRGRAIETMRDGAKVVVAELYARGELDGILGLGGGSGSTIASGAMQALPLGVPKLLVTAKGNGDYRAFVGRKDITVLYSVTDIMGLNPVLRRVLRQAAGAIAGMVESVEGEPPTRRTVALTAFGATTPAAMRCRALLVEQGYEVLVFPADGAGGQNVEELISQGQVEALLDLTTSELADALCGGTASAGPHRLEAAARQGIPQVVAPGAIDFVNFNPPEAVPTRYRDRLFYRHTPSTTLMRTTPEENTVLGRWVGERVGRASGPAAVLVPLGGFSDYDCAGRVFFDPAADQAFLHALRTALAGRVPLRELNMHINDPAFAAAAVETLLDLIAGRTTPGTGRDG